jgi:hypothetical protein
MPEYKIRAVVFKEGKHWVAQCLEYRYAIQTRRLEDMPQELRKCLYWQIRLSREMGFEPFTGFDPAPKRYWEMYERARPWPDSDELPAKIVEPAAELELRVAA